ncbi:MAG: hypothetical protein ACM3SY_21810 [Candidatus Omnitrophota bacterium]
MNRIVNIISVFVVLNFFVLAAGPNFKRIDQWKHDDMCGMHFYSFIDKDNNVIGVFYKGLNFIISRDKLVKFANWGEGPSELMGLEAFFEYKGDLAIVERADKMKIFTKKDGTYVWKETKWLKRGRYLHAVKNGIFFDNKFFLAGVEDAEYVPHKKYTDTYFLRVLDEKGNLLKQQIKKTVTGDFNWINIKHYITGYKKDRVFYLTEHEPKVTVISSKTLEIVKEIALEVPPFYKKMPKDFYITKANISTAEFNRSLENWSMGYSKITNCCTTDKHLVLQIRTCNNKMKKFALLFYNAETFKLENTIFIDDFFLGYKDGKYYFFANGNPSIDDDTDDFIINIYAFTPEKK